MVSAKQDDELLSAAELKAIECRTRGDGLLAGKR